MKKSFYNQKFLKETPSGEIKNYIKYKFVAFCFFSGK